MIFPVFQTIQLLIVLPLVILIMYFLFIRNNYITWKNLGFSTGEKSLRFTLLLGILGGLIIGFYDYFTMNYFILENNQILPNFFEKCIAAPLWEEFFFRVITLTLFEVIFITLLVKNLLNLPKLNIKFTESNKKWIIFEFYVLIVGLNAYFFTTAHGTFTLNIFFFGVVACTVYLKSKSIIAPIISHFISNFVTGGFLFLVLHILFR
ncbi:MAG: CPBP family intramembrane metalloprotease [Actinobacteria bacterium]|nr:CPBP family intramembrane metalloprotease [Actinomycetota bacterium]